MAAMINRTQVGLKSYGNCVIVHDDPKSRLMYYFDCICRVLEMDNSGEIRRLRDYSNFFTLTDDETNKLLLLCVLLSPDELNGKCIFQNDELCGDYDNELLEINAVSRTVVVSESVVVGGERRRVQKIMAFKMCWLENYYLKPMQHFQSNIQQIAREIEAASRPQPWSCSIM